MECIKTVLVKTWFFSLMMIAGQHGFAQLAGAEPDSLYIATLMKDNAGLRCRVDSLDHKIKEYAISCETWKHQADSLRVVIVKLRTDMAFAAGKADTLGVQKLRLTQELLALKEQMLLLDSTLEGKLQFIRDQQFQVSDCQAKLQVAQSVASLNQARLEGKIDVNNTRVEAKDHEIAYLQESMKEKDRITAEKTTELAALYRDKSSSLHILDSLSRAFNARELELVKVSERLKIIEGQYNELLAQRTAATNKKKKVRFVQGVSLKNYRTPDWQLAPQSAATTATYVITNKNAGKIEFDYITGVSLSIYDLSKPEGKYTYDAGLFVGFGGTNLFKNFYVAPTVKAFDFFHFMIGLNMAEYQQLQGGFNEGEEIGRAHV